MSPARWLVSTLLLGTFWLMLVNEISVAQAMLGLALGGTVAALTGPVRPALPQVRRAGTVLQLLAVFAWDMVVANLAVARAALSPRLRLRPRFVHVAIDLQDPAAATLLAAMVTLTPGTVSVDLDLERRELRVHGLLVDDAAAVAALIKARYEARIKEIFQC